MRSVSKNRECALRESASSASQDISKEELRRGSAADVHAEQVAQNSAGELAAALATGEHIQVLDVRRQCEWDAGHIAQAQVHSAVPICRAGRAQRQIRGRVCSPGSIVLNPWRCIVRAVIAARSRPACCNAPASKKWLTSLADSTPGWHKRRRPPCPRPRPPRCPSLLLNNQ